MPEQSKHYIIKNTMRTMMMMMITMTMIGGDYRICKKIAFPQLLAPIGCYATMCTPTNGILRDKRDWAQRIIWRNAEIVMTRHGPMLGEFSPAENTLLCSNLACPIWSIHTLKKQTYKFSKQARCLMWEVVWCCKEKHYNGLRPSDNILPPWSPISDRRSDWRSQIQILEEQALL